MNPKASIIIPVYNAEETLRKCVESIVLGKEPDIEVILCEDCSRDNSWEICLQLATEYNTVRCIRNDENRGVSYTRNQGLNLANAEYILFVDSDDWVAEDYVYELISCAKNNPGSFIVCGYHFIDIINNTNHDYLWSCNDDNGSSLVCNNLIDLEDKVLLKQLWNKVFLNEIIKANDIKFDVNQNMGEDFQFILDYLNFSKINKSVLVNKALYYYTRRNVSTLMNNFGFVNIEAEFKRARNFHILSGISLSQSDRLISEMKNSYIYNIVRNRSHSKKDKLIAIEKVMCDGKAQKHYLKQRLLQLKENISAMLR